MKNDNQHAGDVNPYHAEAKERWGHTDAYKQSEERVKKMTKEDLARITVENETLLHEIAARMQQGAESPEVQALIARHYAGLRNFYEPSPEMYRGLADMYVSDPRFTEYYEKHAVGLAEFMKNAMHHYASSLDKTP